MTSFRSCIQIFPRRDLFQVSFQLSTHPFLSSVPSFVDVQNHFVVCAGQFYTAFMCENSKWKAANLHKAFPDCKFIFTDMHDLGTGRGLDSISGKKVDVPLAPGLFSFRAYLG